ncbi:MAG: prepilin-type N-terminal cleavage/methylation domain-containing protein [Phycisphaerae bacterium]|nr:prepilin-type N-terminal cleavage/methylation domain-containing protein [Phycisphaerae bacterium]
MDNSQKINQPTGLTLVELMVATAVATIIVLAAVSCLYYSALSAREADRNGTAGRLAQLLLENWRDAPRVSTATVPYWPAGFDPVGTYNAAAVDAVADGSLDDSQWSYPVTILAGVEGPALPADAGGLIWTPLGLYKTRITDATYYITLAYATALASAADQGQVPVCGLQAVIGWSRGRNIGYQPDGKHMRAISYE